MTTSDFSSYPVSKLELLNGQELSVCDGGHFVRYSHKHISNTKSELEAGS